MCFYVRMDVLNGDEAMLRGHPLYEMLGYFAQNYRQGINYCLRLVRIALKHGKRRNYSYEI